MKRNTFLISLIVVFMVFLAACGNRVDEKFIPNTTFYNFSGNSLSLSVEWPKVNGQSNTNAAPPAEFNIGTIEIVLINLSEWQEFSEEYSLDEMEDSDLLSYLSFFFLESENVIVKSYDVKPGSPNRDGAKLNDIKTGTYIIYIAGLDVDTSNTTFFALKENIVVADDKTTTVTITASDWLGDYEYQPSGFMLTVAETNSTYVLSPEPDSYGYYEEGTVVTITATPESGNHFCYFKSPGITPYRGAEIPNVTTITMDSDKTLSVVSSEGEYVVYVSNDNGNDTNDGLSPLSPVKTTGKAIDLVQNLIAEYTLGINPSPGLNSGPNFAVIYVVPEQGVEVRFEGNTSGQTYSDNTVSDEIFKMDDQLYFSLSGGWNFISVETGQNILNKTIFDGNESKRHIAIADVFNYDSMPVIDISYISFQNGSVSGYDINDNPERGGAISIINADVNISYCEFLNNESLNEGGAIASFGNTNITDTLFDGNIANKGGAIYTECFFQGVTTIVSDSSFENNYANENGGAIFLQGNISRDNHLDIRNNSFSLNSAEIGGGIYVTQYAQILKVDSSGTYDIDTPFWVRDLIPSAEDGNENPYKNIFIDNLNRNENDSLVGIDVYFE